MYWFLQLRWIERASYVKYVLRGAFSCVFYLFVGGLGIEFCLDIDKRSPFVLEWVGSTMADYWDADF